MDLTPPQKAVIRALMDSPGWEFLESMRDEYIHELKNVRPSGSTAFEELRDLHKREGKIDAMEEFFDLLVKDAM